MKGVPHYKKDGSLYCGRLHKHSDGTMMTGKTMSKDSEKLFHHKDLPKELKKKINGIVVSGFHMPCVFQI